MQIKMKKVKIPIYYGTLVIIYTDNLQEVCDKYGISGDASGTDALVFSDTDKNGVSRFFACFSERGLTGSIMAHESVHIVNDIFSSRGVKLDPSNGEPQAYLTGWIFEQIETFLKNK